MNITILPQTATLQGLESEGSAAGPLTQPPAQFSGIDIDLVGAGGNATGIWESTPGRFARHLPNAEVMHILAGSCTFTPTDGSPQDFRAGDTVFFPAHTTGEWQVHETLRKVYVLMAVPAVAA